MNQPIAKPVIKNKFWVVEDHGQKIATIQAREGGGFVYVYDNQREYFHSTKQLTKQLNIKFSSLVTKPPKDNNYVYGFPIKGKAYNEVFDVIRKLPIYSKNSKSKSLYCAGYYYICLNDIWTLSFCPKNITLNRYKFYGPYKSQIDAEHDFLRIKNASN
jgi:hypothetical protein